MSQRQRRWDELGPASEARERISEMLKLCRDCSTWCNADPTDPNSIWGRLSHNLFAVNGVGDRLWLQAMFQEDFNEIQVSVLLKSKFMQCWEI